MAVTDGNIESGYISGNGIWETNDIISAKNLNNIEEELTKNYNNFKNFTPLKIFPIDLYFSTYTEKDETQYNSISSVIKIDFQTLSIKDDNTPVFFIQERKSLLNNQYYEDTLPIGIIPLFNQKYYIKYWVSGHKTTYCTIFVDTENKQIIFTDYCRNTTSEREEHISTRKKNPVRLNLYCFYRGDISDLKEIQN